MNKVSRKQLAMVIAELAEQTSRDELAASIAAYMIAERRTGELPQLMRDVMRLRAEKTGVAEAVVTSAYPLSNSVEDALRKLLNTDKLVINNVIDPNVLGGVRVETSDQNLDLTVRGRLEAFKYTA